MLTTSFLSKPHGTFVKITGEVEEGQIGKIKYLQAQADEKMRVDHYNLSNRITIEESLAEMKKEMGKNRDSKSYNAYMKIQHYFSNHHCDSEILNSIRDLVCEY